jgi:hypothetical protein
MPPSDLIVAPLHRRQEQQCLLNVRREVKQVHDLRHPRPRDVPQSSQLSVVGDDAIPNQLIELCGRVGRITDRTYGVYCRGLLPRKEPVLRFS